MSEKITVRHEKHESITSAERLLPTAEKAEPLRKNEKDPVEALIEARAKIHETTRAEKSNPMERLQASEKAAQPSQPLHVNRELKAITLKRELHAIQRKLSKPQKALSKVIHQPIVSAVSEPLSKTVSRPSGLLGGGLVALIGTSAYLYITKTNDMRYNYFVFLALFFGGFIVGIAIELLVHSATTSSRHAND